MDTVLITGAMGFLGTHLTERLLKAGKTVWALDLFDPPHARHLQDYDRFHLVVDTIRNRTTLQKLVDRADTICHLAAVACPDQYVRNPRKVMDISLLAGLDLVEMVRLTDKFFFFTSTSEVYGKSPALPFAEDDDRVLGSTDVNRWCYSTSKSALEHYLKACHQEHQLDYAIVRLFNVYGPHLKGRVVSRYVEAAVENRPLIVHGDGNQTRCFTYVDDVVEAFLGILNNPKAHNQTFNIGNPVETSILDLARTVLREAGRPETDLEFVSHQSAVGDSYEDIPRRVPDISRIREVLGWEPSTDLRTGLQRMIHDYRFSFESSVSPARQPLAVGLSQ